MTAAESHGDLATEEVSRRKEDGRDVDIKPRRASQVLSHEAFFSSPPSLFLIGICNSFHPQYTLRPPGRRRREGG